MRGNLEKITRGSDDRKNLAEEAMCLGWVGLGLCRVKACELIRQSLVPAKF